MKAELLAAHAQAQAALDAEKAIIDAMPDDVVPEPVPDPVPAPPPPPPPPPPAPPPAPPPPPPPPAPEGTIYTPAAPQPPVGPFVLHSAMQASPTVSLSKRSFASNYMAIEHADPSMVVDLTLTDIDCSNVGSLFYSHGPGDNVAVEGKGCGTSKAVIARVRCPNVKKGRAFFRFRGQTGEVEITDVDITFEATPTTSTGDIPTGIQFGGKGTGENLKKIVARRWRVQGAKVNWPAGDYWNGDGLTAERSVDALEAYDICVKGSSDAAIDTKARTNIIEGLYSEDNRCAVKSWDDTTGKNITSINENTDGGIGGSSHFRLMGSSSRPRVHTYTNVYAVGNVPLIRVENGSVLFHGSGHYEGPDLVQKANGGSLMAGSTWNGTVIA